MNQPRAFDSCFSLVNSQLQPAPPSSPLAGRPWHAVTFSRQTGCGAHLVAEKLATLLHRRGPVGAVPWKVFDRDLIERVLEDHNLPARLAQFLPEDRISELQDIMDELVGLRPGSFTIARQTGETILHLAELGNVIFIGRGSTIVTARLPGVFHVRLVAPLEKRIDHAREFYHLSPPAARKFCRHEDLGRKRYLKKYFGADIDDPLLYHLVVNTGMMSFDEAAQTIARTMLEQARPGANLTSRPAFPIRAYG
jgi:cytidylate kinase